MATNPQPNQTVTYDASTGTLREKVNKAGLPASPSTAPAAGALGATPDQQKMVGTPNQLPAQYGAGTGESAAVKQEQAAPPQPGQPAKTLEQADRAAAFQPGMPSAVDAQAQQRREEMKKAYGDVGLGVDNMIRAAIARRSIPTATGYSVDTASLEAMPEWATLDAGKKQGIQSTLAALQANPADANAYVAAQRALSEAGFSTSQVSSLLKQSSAAQMTAEQVADEVPVDMESLAGFGISPEDLALIGLSPGQVRGMTLSQFQTRLREGLQANANRVAGLQAQLQDPTLDPASKRQIQEQLRALGAAGGYKSEQDVQTILDQQIANPDEQIQIGSRSYTVEEMLDDTNMSGLIQEYLDSPANSDVRKQLDQKFPQLAKFIQENEATLKQASEQLAATEGTVQKTQAANAAIMESFANSGVSTTDAQALLKSMFPEMGDQFSLQSLDPSKSGILAALSDPATLGVNIADPKQRSEFQAAVKQLVKFGRDNPELGTELAQLTPDELRKLGAFRSAAEGTPFSQFLAGLSDQKRVRSMSGDELARYMFGAPAKDMWSEMQMLRSTGNYDAANKLRSMLDTDSDGKLDSPAQLKKAMAARLGKNPASIRDVLAGKKSTLLPTGKNVRTALSKKLGPLFADGKLTDEELKGSLSKLSDAELEQFAKSAPTSINANTLVQERQRRNSVRNQKEMPSLVKKLNLDGNSSLAKWLLGTGKLSPSEIMRGGGRKQAEQVLAALKQKIGSTGPTVSSSNYDPRLRTYIDVLTRLLSK